MATAAICTLEGSWFDSDEDNSSPVDPDPNPSTSSRVAADVILETQAIMIFIVQAPMSISLKG